MSDSILNSTKKALDVPEDYDVFDGSIIMHINSVFSTLNQLGVGPVGGYAIEGSTPTWTQYLEEKANLNFVKSYMYLRVRYLFDPPATSFMFTAMKEQMAELEWRINAERELESTHLLGGHKRITGNFGDEYRIRLVNPVGKTLINSSGSYSAEFNSQDGSRYSDAVLDVSRRSEGILFLSVVIKTGTYTVRRVSPQRTVLVLDVSAQ